MDVFDCGHICGRNSGVNSDHEYKLANDLHFIYSEHNVRTDHNSLEHYNSHRVDYHYDDVVDSVIDAHGFNKGYIFDYGASTDNFYGLYRRYYEAFELKRHFIG
ncbi:hypothetical protein AAVH_06333 [Aphelenchoides avenae]|nr:hypothetical protein AAVH_06333 [Aphelenchus avenae]